MPRLQRLRQVADDLLDNELSDLFWFYRVEGYLSSHQEARWDALMRERERRLRHSIRRPDCSCERCF